MVAPSAAWLSKRMRVLLDVADVPATTAVHVCSTPAGGTFVADCIGVGHAAEEQRRSRICNEASAQQRETTIPRGPSPPSADRSSRPRQPQDALAITVLDARLVGEAGQDGAR